MEPRGILEIPRRQKMIVLYVFVVALFALGALAPLFTGGSDE